MDASSFHPVTCRHDGNQIELPQKPTHIFLQAGVGSMAAAIASEPSLAGIKKRAGSGLGFSHSLLQHRRCHRPGELPENRLGRCLI